MHDFGRATLRVTMKCHGAYGKHNISPQGVMQVNLHVLGSTRAVCLWVGDIVLQYCLQTLFIVVINEVASRLHCCSRLMTYRNSNRFICPGLGRLAFGTQHEGVLNPRSFYHSNQRIQRTIPGKAKSWSLLGQFMNVNLSGALIGVQEVLNGCDIMTVKAHLPYSFVLLATKSAIQISKLVLPFT